jgi:hypothetical protein
VLSAVIGLLVTAHAEATTIVEPPLRCSPTSAGWTDRGAGARDRWHAGVEVESTERRLTTTPGDRGTFSTVDGR